jgi:type IX secretion system PorP/SprF family membrane protein
MHFRRISKCLRMFVLLFCAYQANAQISPLYPEHINYMQFINPAMTGSDRYPIIDLSYKQYWVGTQYAPSTACLGGSMRLGAFDFYNPKGLLSNRGFFTRSRMGFGGIIMKASDGPMNSYNFTFSYAYYIPLNSSNTELSLGLSAQFLYYNIDQSLLDPYAQGDPALNNLNDNHIVPESGFGAYFHNSQLYIGASVNDLLLTNLPYTSNSIGPNKRDYFFNGGYKFFLKYFDLEPSLYMAQIDNMPLNGLMQLKLYYKDYNWLAVAYRSTKVILVSVGINVHHIYITYTFEHSLSQMANYFGSSHEIMLGVNIGPNEPNRIKKHTVKSL